jgi:hypothetical protein
MTSDGSHLPARRQRQLKCRQTFSERLASIPRAPRHILPQPVRDSNSFFPQIKGKAVTLMLAKGSSHHNAHIKTLSMQNLSLMTGSRV